MASDARAQVLARVRRSLGRTDAEQATARTEIEARIAAHRPNLIPARGDLDPAGRMALFIAQAEAVQATVARLPRHAAIPEAVASYLRDLNLPTKLVMAGDPTLTELGWQATMLDVRAGRAEEDDAVGLTAAFAGVAETGTTMLLSDQSTPTTVAFLPETSIIVVPGGRIVRAYEDAIELLRTERAALPRSVNLISGPSRSGDIEQTLQLGAHGPRRLHLLIVGDHQDDAPDGDRPSPAQ